MLTDGNPHDVGAGGEDGDDAAILDGDIGGEVEAQLQATGEEEEGEDDNEEEEEEPTRRRVCKRPAGKAIAAGPACDQGGLMS